MLNLIQGKLVIANPTNLTSSLREAAVLQRSNPNIVTFMDYFVATKVSPRNDVSVFNNKLLQSYGKSQGGKPITIGYNPTNQQYFSFSNKGSNNSSSIYDAISGSTQGKYSSDFLQNIACPITASSGTPKPPPPFSVPPDIPASNKPAAESTEFRWTEEGITKLLATSQTKNNQPFDYSILFLNKDEQGGKDVNSATIYSKLTAEEKAQIIALSGSHFDPSAIDHIEGIYNKCLAEIEARKDQPVKSVEDRMDQAVKYTNKILEDASNDPYKMQVAEYRIGGEVTGLILRTITDNIQKATDQLPKTKALLTTPFACAGEILGYVVNPVVNYLDPKGKIRQDIDNIPDEGTKTLLGITGGAALGVGVGLAVKGAVDTAKKVVLKAAGIEAAGGVGSALTATEGATTLGKGAVAGEVAGIGENALVGDLGLVEVESNAKIETALEKIALGNKEIVPGSLRELTALEIKLACEELAASGGKGTVMAGAGHKRAIDEINRIVKDHGGSPDEWVKMTTKDFTLRDNRILDKWVKKRDTFIDKDRIRVRDNVVLPPGSNVQMHYYQNIKTGEIVEIKPKLENKK